MWLTIFFAMGIANALNRSPSVTLGPRVKMMYIQHSLLLICSGHSWWVFWNCLLHSTTYSTLTEAKTCLGAWIKTHDVLFCCRAQVQSRFCLGLGAYGLSCWGIKHSIWLFSLTSHSWFHNARHLLIHTLNSHQVYRLLWNNYWKGYIFWKMYLGGLGEWLPSPPPPPPCISQQWLCPQNNWVRDLLPQLCF